MALTLAAPSAWAENTVPPELTELDKQDQKPSQAKRESLGWEIVYSSNAKKVQYWWNDATKICVSLKIKSKKIDGLSTIENKECESRLAAARKVWEGKTAEGAFVKKVDTETKQCTFPAGAKARQTLVVILESGNRSCNSNVTAPGEDSAMFVGSTSGSRFVGEAPKDGEYIVRLYLMRNAARRGETAAYTIHFAVAGGGQGSTAAVPADTPPTRYDASGKVKCSADKPALDQWCNFRVIRYLPRKAADIWIANIAVKSEERYRFFHYENEVFTTDDKAKLSWQRQDDNWWVAVDGQEFSLLPDALIFGG